MKLSEKEREVIKYYLELDSEKRPGKIFIRYVYNVNPNGYYLIVVGDDFKGYVTTMVRVHGNTFNSLVRKNAFYYMNAKGERTNNPLDNLPNSMGARFRPEFLKQAGF